MLTHRKRSFTPEALMDELWIAENYSDPRNTLRRQMHRLRKALQEDKISINDNSLIFSNGYYRWYDQINIQIDIYEETFHIHLLETLIIKGEYRQAFEHYKYITDFLDREMGVKPSDNFRAIYKRLLQSQSIIQSNENLYDVFEPQVFTDHAFYCEPKVFKSIYELERRRSQRSNEGFSIGVLTAIPKRGYTYSQKELRMYKRKQFLLEHLRKGDIFTKWNDQQFVVLLPGINETLTEKVLSRVLLINEMGGSEFTINQITHLKAKPGSPKFI